MNTSSAFITYDYVIIIWFSHLHVLIWKLIQSKSALNQRCFRADPLCFSLNQRCSERKKSALFQRLAALNQRCSALIFLALKHWVFSTEQRWFRADYLWNSAEFFRSEQRWFREKHSWSALKHRWYFHFFWISAKKRQISETTLFSADCFWNFNPELSLSKSVVVFPINNSWANVDDNNRSATAPLVSKNWFSFISKLTANL